MSNELTIYYLEIVTSDVDQVSAAYTQSLALTFSEPVPELGGAIIAPLKETGFVGIRPPMHETEAPTTRPYYLVDDINSAVEEATEAGGTLVLPPMTIPDRGQCAIVMFDTIQNGYWQK